MRFKCSLNFFKQCNIKQLVVKLRSQVHQNSENDPILIFVVGVRISAF